MKKIKLISCLIFGLFLLSIYIFHLPVYATSGACSYHGGVDCSLGASSDGNAICNDGTESSVSYSAMEECNTNPSITNLCSLPTPVGCTQDFEVAQYQSLCVQEQAESQDTCRSMNTSFYRTGGSGTPPPCNAPSIDACTEAILCQTQVTANNAATQSYNTCINNTAQQIEQQGQDETNSAEALLQQSEDQLRQLNLNASCGDPFATYDQTTSMCVCRSGYVYANGKCNMTQTEFDLMSDEVNTSTSTEGTNNFSSASDFAPTQAPSVKIKPKTSSIQSNVSINNIFATSTPPSLDNIFGTTTTSTISTTTPTPVPQPSIHKSFLSKLVDFIKNIF